MKQSPQVDSKPHPVSQVLTWADDYDREGGHALIVQMLRSYAALLAASPQPAEQPEMTKLLASPYKTPINEAASLLVRARNMLEQVNPNYSLVHVISKFLKDHGVSDALINEIHGDERPLSSEQVAQPGAHKAID